MGFFDSWKVDVKTYLKYPVVVPGNIVEGYVSIAAKSDIEYVAVRVKLTGKEKVAVTRMVDTGRRDEQNQPIRERRTYYESNVVYKQLITLAGAMKMSGQRHAHRMPAGNWSYPFAFQLPIDLPPSFSQSAGDGDTASLVYSLKSYCDIPMGRDAVHRSFFTVLKPMPAGQWVAPMPVSVDRYFDITCCCCVSKGKVNARFYMDRTLISIDRDNLTICCAIDNTNGEEPVEGVEFSLAHLLTYTVRAPWETITEKARLRPGHAVIKQKIAPGQKGIIQGVIPLPRNITPSLRTFNVASEYLVQLELNIPWASDPSHQFPVIISQCVDDTNVSPPVNFNQCSFRLVPKGVCPEFYYQPPPAPVYAFQPIPTMGSPMGPPPPQAMLSYASYNPGLVPLPPPTLGFSAPTAYADQTYGAQVHWGAGFAQAYAPPPPAAAAAAAGAGGMPGAPVAYYGTDPQQQHPAQPAPATGAGAQQPLLNQPY